MERPKFISVKIDGNKVEVTDGTTVAAAILNLGQESFRHSVTHEPRSPLCGMGICFECRVTINGERHQVSCTRMVEDEMEVVTVSEPPA